MVRAPHSICSFVLESYLNCGLRRSTGRHFRHYNFTGTVTNIPSYLFCQVTNKQIPIPSTFSLQHSDQNKMLNCTVIPGALLYALLSRLVYDKYTTVQNRVEKYGFHALSSFGNRTTDTEGFVVTNHIDCLENHPSITRVTVVVFRGTEGKSLDNGLFNPTDLFTDLDFGKVRVVGDGRADYKVHVGFHRAYWSVHFQVNDILRRYTSPGDPVVFTGHSLGGALATIAAFDRTPSLPSLVTFGCPPVGNFVFANFFNRWPHYRSRHFVMNGDIFADESSPGLMAFMKTKGFHRTPWRVSLPGVEGPSHAVDSYVSMVGRLPN